MNNRRAALYLQIPSSYCRSFGGLRWAQNGEAVEFLDGPEAGRTFAFAAEIGQFFEGLLSGGGACPAFGTVLHLMGMFGLRGSPLAGLVASFHQERLAGPFRELRNPLRNAGALSAWLCRDLAGVADPPELADINELLNGGRWIPQMVLSHPMLGAMDYAEQPAMSASQLDSWISARLDDLSDEAIRHWLQHGRGPLGGLDDVAPPLPPGGLAETLARVEERPRLSGLNRLVARLEGALGLPPRRLEHEGPQVDGYWDLTTRGTPEQILPIQFALEDEEFLRRFAERELLYFHRERPRRPVVQELVLLLDQGVRTWGDVRLLLAGAAMAMARQAGRRKLAVRITTTGSGDGLVDLARLSPDRLGQVLEASDLTKSPAPGLARVLGDDAGILRDVVLLTHPRSLSDPEVVEAASRPDPAGSTRLFAVAADVGGEVELAELRHGRPVSLGRCRVDLSEPPPVPSRAPRPTTRAAPRAAWRGDVEPIPFPFRCGLPGAFGELIDKESRLLDFDEGGTRILVALRNGMLCVAAVDGSDLEILPRPMVQGEVLKPVVGVIGVSGGFVVLGSRQGVPVLAHYDFTLRFCDTHIMPPHAGKAGGLSWCYYPDVHSLGARPRAGGGPGVGCDLSARGASAASTPRAASACERALAGIPPFPQAPYEVETNASEPWIDPTCVLVKLDAGTGTLTYHQRHAGPRSLTPTVDGHPALKGARITSTQQGGDVLAVQVESRSIQDVWFLSMVRGAVLGRFSYELEGPARGWFVLSRDGRRFARRVGEHLIEIRDVPGDRPPVLVVSRERSWHHSVSLGRSCLLLREFDQPGARRPHAQVLIRWGVGRLTVEGGDPTGKFAELGGGLAQARGFPGPGLSWRFDRTRFVGYIEHGKLRVLVDQYNHLAVLGGDDRVVAVFCMSGQEFAAWMPDGTCLGTSRLIGGEPTKDAAARIAAALRDAERGEGGHP